MFRNSAKAPDESLRSLLMLWIIGAGSIFALLFIVFSPILLNLGVLLKLKGLSESLVAEYAMHQENNPGIKFPADDYYKLYLGTNEIPDQLLELFNPEKMASQEWNYYVDDDYDKDNYTAASEFRDLCDGKKCRILFFYSYRILDGDWVYILTGVEQSESEGKEREFIQTAALYFGVLIIILFSLLALLLFRRISHPVQEIASWASDLDFDNLDEELPSFRYRELNLVAERLKESFVRTAKSLEKEHKFLQYASHELRTPIAVASGNIEILKKIHFSENLSSMESAALERIQHSIKDMRLLTETLLWLNRDDAICPPVECVDLLALCREAIADNRYLLEGKTVSVEIFGDRCIVEVPPIYCAILLSNLIRNAFQHTQAGGVRVQVDEEKLSILNWEAGSSSGASVSTSEQVGFGLGLDLVEKIASRIGWQYQCSIQDDGRCCTLIYASPV